MSVSLTVTVNPNADGDDELEQVIVNALPLSYDAGTLNEYEVLLVVVIVQSGNVYVTLTVPPYIYRL